MSADHKDFFVAHKSVLYMSKDRRKMRSFGGVASVDNVSLNKTSAVCRR